MDTCIAKSSCCTSTRSKTHNLGYDPAETLVGYIHHVNLNAIAFMFCPEVLMLLQPRMWRVSIDSMEKPPVIYIDLSTTLVFFGIIIENCKGGNHMDHATYRRDQHDGIGMWICIQHTSS